MENTLCLLFIFRICDCRMALDPKVDKLIHSSNRRFLLVTSFPKECVHVKGVPLIVPISLTFQPNPDVINPTDPWEIFGTLGVDYPDIQFRIYNRMANDPDKPTPDINGILRLADPICRPISCFFPALPLKVNLFDIKRNLVLIRDGTTSLDYTDYTNYDKVDYKPVQGHHGTLLLKYITYRTAVFAHVKIVFMKNDEQDATNMVAVTGSVTGSWYYDVPDISLHSDHNESECSCISIFNNQNVQVSLGKSMDLSRPVLAVPAYSLLVVHVDLNVSEYGAISNVVVFPACDDGYFGEFIQGPNGLVCDVQVRFFHEFDYYEGMETDEDDGSGPNNDDKEKKIKVDHDTEALSSYTLFSIDTGRGVKGEKLIEIFSILVSAKNGNDACNIHGKVKVSDLHHKNFYVYDKDKSNGEKVEGKGTLCLEGPHDISFVLSNNIKVDLKDGDRDFCKGFVNWSDALAEKIWLDSHICSVIKGQHGYAAIHYMIYSAAVQGTVKLYLTSSNRFNRFGSVSGKIAAEHSYHEYGTYFDKEYYRSIVFSGTLESPAFLPEEEEPIPVRPEYVETGILSSDSRSKSPKLFRGTGIRLPLSKSIVCVPHDTSLIFDLNLSAKVEMESSELQDLAFSGRAEFETGRQKCVVFQKGNVQMCLLVDWRDPEAGN